MRTRIFKAMVVTSFLIGTAYAQTATQPDTNTSVASNGLNGALNACYTAIGDQPRTALQSCLNSKLLQATAHMHIAYEKTKTVTKKIDSSATAKALVSLRNSQQSFENFKNAQCQWQGDAAMGGSGAGDFIISCKIDLTEWRTGQLSIQNGNS